MSKDFNIKVKAFDDLFRDTIDNDEKKSSDIKEISLDMLHTFKNHPFKVREDERFLEMVDSIKKYGVLVPGICRMRPQGGYEIIAGHTRRKACEMAGLKTMPMMIKDMDDDEATIVMIDSNIQREDILISEKAKAYKMKYDAIKHQGAKGNSLSIMSDDTGESAKQIQRYIWLARLSDELLDLVDNKKIQMCQAVDLSFLTAEEQGWLFEILKLYFYEAIKFNKTL